MNNFLILSLKIFIDPKGLANTNRLSTLKSTSQNSTIKWMKNIWRQRQRSNLEGTSRIVMTWVNVPIREWVRYFPPLATHRSNYLTQNPYFPENYSTLEGGDISKIDLKFVLNQWLLHMLKSWLIMTMKNTYIVSKRTPASKYDPENFKTIFNICASIIFSDIGRKKCRKFFSSYQSTIV